MSISDLIQEAFRQASDSNQKVHELWIYASQELGKLLPDSLLEVAIQRTGELDLLLRCMENERIEKWKNRSNNEIDFSFHYQVMLSELWIGQIYEFIRLLQERKLITRTDKFKELAHELRLIRITIEKHEIAADKKLDSPLLMEKKPFFNEKTDHYTYTKNDPIRSHIMPTGVSERGSLMWQPTDVMA